MTDRSGHERLRYQAVLKPLEWEQRMRVDYRDDVLRIVAVLAADGIAISEDVAFMAWHRFSEEDRCAGWYGPGTDDQTGLETLLAAVAMPAMAQISDDVVKIGILNDQSGVYADFGGTGSVEAARMAVEDFGGTVLDAPIEVVSADHQNKADIASTIARQWYDTEQVDSIMELTTSSVGLAVQALSKEKKKITITTGAGLVGLAKAYGSLVSTYPRCA